MTMQFRLAQASATGSLDSIAPTVSISAPANNSSFTTTRINVSSTVIRSLSGVGTTPNGLDVDSAGNVYVAVTGDNQVKKFKPTVGSFQLDTTFNGMGYLYIADTGNNRVVLVSLPGDEPLTAAWNSMVARATAGDISGALSSFSSVSAEGYRATFLTLGASDVASLIGQIGPLTPVFIRNDTAEYYFEQTVDGRLLLFPVEFVKEDGVWKIEEF